MLSNSSYNLSNYIEFYGIVYATVLVLGVSLFSINSSYSHKTISYLTDIGCLSRFKLLSLLYFFFFCLIGGVPPFITFISKFYILSVSSYSSVCFFLLIFLVSLLVYYLSVFKFLRVDFSYKKSIEFISFNTVYVLLLFLCLNLILSYCMHIISTDLL